MGRPLLSFELFPPNSEKGFEKLDATWQVLERFHPDFFSVTFGAGGHSQLKSFQVIQAVREHGLKVAAHLTCIGLSKQAITEILAYHQRHGVKHLVLIRGDLPKGETSHSGDFRYASELVAFVRQQTGDHFHISVAAYPEFHPEAENVTLDVAHFKEKVHAGANDAITQYFFNREAYCLFRDNCLAQGISVPIIPGIMPISDLGRLERFSKVCGADIPQWLHKRLDAYRDDPPSLKALGTQIMTRLCSDLLAEGAPGLHFYTLNESLPTISILQAMQWSPQKRPIPSAVRTE